MKFLLHWFKWAPLPHHSVSFFSLFCSSSHFFPLLFPCWPENLVFGMFSQFVHFECTPCVSVSHCVAVLVCVCVHVLLNWISSAGSSLVVEKSLPVVTSVLEFHTHLHTVEHHLIQSDGESDEGREWCWGEICSHLRCSRQREIVEGEDRWEEWRQNDYRVFFHWRKTRWRRERLSIHGDVERQMERKEDLEILESPLADKATRNRVKTSMRGW